MVEGGAERRLAAIVAIDVAGYSRLMGVDEQGTLARLKEHRAITDPICIKHGGRIVGSAGDGLLLEFPSVVAAVECAVEMQQAMGEHNADLPNDKKMLYRIGINLGDVLVDDEDIYGDGVNVAARIEALAEPGGISISRAARDQVRDRIDIALEDMGEVDVKNIARPVRVFRVLPEGEAPASPRSQLPTKKLLVAAVIALLIAVVGGGAWWWQAKQPDFEPADPAEMALSLPDKPSIAVLPFDNLSGDPDQDYLGDGLTENIIAVLATSPDLFVIARNSSFIFRGKATKVQHVAEQLGVRYVLEGSVQRAGDKLRVTAQLVDALDGRHLWAERYDRELSDYFAVLDEITNEILVAMHVKLTVGQDAKSYWKYSKDLETYRLIIQASALFQSRSLDNHREAERLIKEALVREPENSAANMWMGYLHRQKVQLGLSKDPKGDFAKARQFAEKALSSDEENAVAYLLLATLDLFAGDYETATAHADRALELSPSNGTTAGLGRVLIK